MLEQCGDIRLISTDTVECFRQNDIELATLSILQESLDARSQDHAGAGNSRILVSADDRPLLALGLLPADAQLVFDRRITLIVRGIACIQRNAGHRRLPLCSSKSAAHRGAPRRSCSAEPVRGT